MKIRFSLNIYFFVFFYSILQFSLLPSAMANSSLSNISAGMCIELFKTAASKPLVATKADKLAPLVKKKYADIFKAVFIDTKGTEYETRLQKLLEKTDLELVEKYFQLAFDQKISDEEFIDFMIDPLLKGNLPAFQSKRDYELFDMALIDEITPEVKSFAYYNWRQLLFSHPQLALRLRAISRSQENDLKLKTKDKYISMLWYPHYPDGSPSCSHTKILVDGQVWSTMNEYRPMREKSVHEKLARRSISHSYFEFKIKVRPVEIERIKFLLENNDRRGTGIGMCVQGACGALRESGVLFVPPPFNQLPSLAAFYMAIRRVFPGGVGEIRFHGKNALRSLTSVDIVIDGLIAGGATLSGTLLTVLLASDSIPK